MKWCHRKTRSTEHWLNVQAMGSKETDRKDWEAMVAWSWEQSEARTERGTRNLLEVMDTFHIVTIGVVSQIYTDVKIHQIVDIKWMQFIVQKWYLNKLLGERQLPSAANSLFCIRFPDLSEDSGVRELLIKWVFSGESSRAVRKQGKEGRSQQE